MLAVAFLVLFKPSGNLTGFYYYREDSWLLRAGVALVTAASIRLRGRNVPLAAGIWPLLVIPAGLLLICLAGHYWVLAGYDMSRDEQMATFDAAIFASGHLIQHIPAMWRDHSPALQMAPFRAAPSAWVPPAKLVT